MQSNFLRPTKLKILFLFLFFILTPIFVVMIYPIPIIYLLGGLDNPNLLLQDIQRALSWGLLYQLLIGIICSYLFSCIISEKYYHNLANKRKAVSYLILRFIIFSIIYLVIMTILGSFLVGKNI